MDYTGYQAPTVYAVPSKKSMIRIIKYVGQQVQDGLLDEPSRHLFCSMPRRYDRYQTVFGDVPPELLHLEYGPSQRHPGPSCLSAVFYPYLWKGKWEGPVLRMDVGADISFANSLQEPADATPMAMIRRRIQMAIR